MSTNQEIIQAAAQVLIEAALRQIQNDPHQWSERPCSTCLAVSSILGKPFGCSAYAVQRAKQREREPK